MSVDTNNNALSNMDEIVFERRNKAYGAYDLRTAYSGLLTKAFLIGTISFLALVISSFVYMKIKDGKKTDDIHVTATVLDVPPEVEEEIHEDLPQPPPPKAVEPPKQEVVQDMIPEPSPKPINEKPPKKLEEVKDTTIGTKDVVGEKMANTPPPPPSAPTGTGKVAEVKAPSNEIVDVVDQEAEFDGGIAGFRNKIVNDFDTSGFEDEAEIKANVSFVVERDGSLTDIRVTGDNSTFNKECERTIKNLRIKCKAAKLNGEPVRSRFRMPMKMQFQ